MLGHALTVALGQAEQSRRTIAGFNDESTGLGLQSVNSRAAFTRRRTERLRPAAPSLCVGNAAQTAGSVMIEHVEVRAVTRLFGATARAALVINARLYRHPAASPFSRGPTGPARVRYSPSSALCSRRHRARSCNHPLGAEVNLVRPHIGWVAHESLCYRELTARQNVELAARVYGVDGGRSSADEVAEARRCGPARRPSSRRVGTLSRAGSGSEGSHCARAGPRSGPRGLLLDEPWSGLDRASAEHLQQALLEERARGAVVIVVNHTDGLAERLGARCVRLENGRVA